MPIFLANVRFGTANSVFMCGWADIGIFLWHHDAL